MKKILSAIITAVIMTVSICGQVECAVRSVPLNESRGMLTTMMMYNELIGGSNPKHQVSTEFTKFDSGTSYKNTTTYISENQYHLLCSCMVNPDGTVLSYALQVPKYTTNRPMMGMMAAAMICSAANNLKGETERATKECTKFAKREIDTIFFKSTNENKYFVVKRSEYNKDYWLITVCAFEKD